MDKSWMNLPRPSKEYREGVKFFLDFAFEKSVDGMILCPCRKCKNGLNKTREVVEGHLLWEGFLDGYIKWVLHGELFTNGGSPSYEYDRGNVSDDIQGMLNDMFNKQTGDNHLEDATGAEGEKPTAEAEKFYKLMEDAEQELYPGCTKFSKLSFIVRMLQIKCLGNWSNNSFTMMLNLLSEAFPDGAQLPRNYYETKKIMRDLGLDYKKIEACRNDCMLYWGEKESKTKCDTCDEQRWITTAQEEEPNAIEQGFISNKRAKKVPAKILWHFPLKPRLQRLFMNLKTASLMRWHKEERINDGVMRHPADSPTWQNFDYNKAQDSRNVRLGLATDGFNPFRTMSVAHSTWPVILMPYNLPPGACMKKSFFMLSLLIPGPTEHGNDLDVYLEPLVEELKELWHEGINTYDAALKQNFVMRAALLWTISDLPGHANISGWSTKGKYACPVCQKHTNSKRLRNSMKFCYMCHRVFLPRNHTYRKDKVAFDGTEELRKAPTYLKGSEILNQIKDFDNRFGKKVGDLGLPFNWKKKSIFFELPYWEKNLLRHNLDVMHVEKNVCDKVLYTLLDSDKSKDNHRARLDMKDMGIRPGLWPFRDESGREWLPPSSFTLSKSEKDIFCKVLKNIKVPDGYSSNVSRCVHLKPIKIFGLKSHDSHVLMQQLLPISLRKLLPKAVRSALIRLCGYFRELCSKTLNPVDLDRMEKEIPVILCQLEKIFPPSFFDITVHLIIHLVTEAKLGGPVHYRWMYPIERYLSTLKSYVRNRCRPEGSIAEGYLAEECLAFCSLYFDEHVETRRNRQSRNCDGEEMDIPGLNIFSMLGRPLWKGESTVLSSDILTKAHRYILFNCDEIQPYRDQHMAELRRKKRRSGEHEIRRNHSESFPSWFSSHVEQLKLNEDDHDSSDVIRLARGPMPVGKRYKGYIINGFRFHTKEMEKNRKTQNSGVMVNATTTSFASKKDKRPILGEITYYGILKDIVELDYTGGKRIVLFDCEWVSKGRRLKEDDDGFTLTNFSDIKRQLEPFTLASQVQQVFYVQDPTEKNWNVVIKTKARDKFDYGSASAENEDVILESEPCTTKTTNVDEDVVWVRDGVPGIPVDTLQEN